MTQLLEMESERLQELIDVARAEGRAEGWQAGAEETLRAMTQLTTMVNDRRTVESLRLLLRVMDRVTEDERPSVYWSTEP